MAIKRPDEYQHQNPNLAIADADSVRGGARVVANRTALYALTSKADQLKQDVTIVRIKSDSLNGGDSTTVRLIDIASIGSAAGWEVVTAPGGGGFFTARLPVKTVTAPMVQSDGTVRVPVPITATDLGNLYATQVGNNFRTNVAIVNWMLFPGELRIPAEYRIKVDDVITGRYYVASSATPPDPANPFGLDLVELPGFIEGAIVTNGDGEEVQRYEPDPEYWADFIAGLEAPPSTTLVVPKQVWVASNGNNSTAQVGHQELPYLTIAAALTALGSAGGVVHIGIGAFVSPTPSVIPNNIWLRGSGKPATAGSSGLSYLVVNPSGMLVYNIVPTHLVGGTILTGTLNCGLRDYVMLTDLGVDTGSDWCTASNGGAAAEGLLFAQDYSGGFTSPDGTHPVQSASRQRAGIVVREVVALCRDANAAVHAGLFENLVGPLIRNFTAVFGTHGIVLKTVGAIATGLQSFGHQSNDLIIKGNFYALSQHNSISGVLLGCVVAGDSGGIRFSNGDGNTTSVVSDVSLSDVKVVGTSYGVVNENTYLERLNITNVSITGCVNDGFTLGGFQRSVLDNITVTGCGGKGFVLTSNDTRNKVVNLNAFDNGGVGMQLDATTGNRLDVSGLTAIGNASSIAYTSTRVTAWGRIVVDSAPTGTPTVGSGTVVLSGGAPSFDATYITPPQDLLTGASYAGGTVTRTAPNNGTFDAGTTNTTAVRAAGAAAKFGFLYMVVGNRNAAIILDERIVFVEVGNARYGAYIIGAGGSAGNFAVHYQGDAGTDTGHAALPGYEYFLAVGTDNIVHLVETNDRVTFTTVYTFPGTYSGELRMHTSVYNDGLLPGLVSQNIA